MSDKKFPNIIYAGDRELSLKVLKFIIGEGYAPSALMVSDLKHASHAKELVNSCKYLDKHLILEGEEFRAKNGIRLLQKIKPDYLICIHFPYIIPKEILSIPSHGVLNLHPAYLPYNRGWHTPTWAILDGVPYGATLHFMDSGVDTGDIIHQKHLKVFPDDTADKLYKRVLDLELEVFKEAWPSLISGTYERKAQPANAGSAHKKTDLIAIQQIDMGKEIKTEKLIRILRALTTSSPKEAAYFKSDNAIYRMQVKIIKDEQS